MENIKFEPLQVLIRENLHSDYYNTLVLKSSLNTLSYKKVIEDDASTEELVNKVNSYNNQMELLEFVKLSTNSKVTFKDMILPSLAEPIIEFN